MRAALQELLESLQNLEKRMIEKKHTRMRRRKIYHFEVANLHTQITLDYFHATIHIATRATLALIFSWVLLYVCDALHSVSPDPQQTPLAAF